MPDWRKSRRKPRRRTTPRRGHYDEKSPSGPCSFTHSFTFGAGVYAVGDKVAMLVEWNDGQTDHQMLSPPFFIVSSVRRLANETTNRRLLGRRLWDEADWNERLSAHSESCGKQDLHFEVSYGVMARARMVDELAKSMWGGTFRIWLSTAQRICYLLVHWPSEPVVLRSLDSKVPW